MRAPFMAAAPDCPPGVDAGQLFDHVHWHQGWEVFRGVRTPGANPVSLLSDKARLPADLTGKRVLDVGAWNGRFSFECERRGASEVVAYSLENPRFTGFDRLKAALGGPIRARVRLLPGAEAARRVRSHLILFFGVLYHLRYPLLAIDRLRTVSRGDVLGRPTRRPVATSSARLSPRSAGCFPSRGCRGRLPLAAVQGIRAAPQNQSNWFGPNVPAVIEAFDSAGFVTEHLASWDDGTRSAFRATATSLPSRLTDGTYEGVSSFHTHLTGVRGTDPDLFQRD